MVATSTATKKIARRSRNAVANPLDVATMMIVTNRGTPTTIEMTMSTTIEVRDEKTTKTKIRHARVVSESRNPQNLAKTKIASEKTEMMSMTATRRVKEIAPTNPTKVEEKETTRETTMRTTIVRAAAAVSVRAQDDTRRKRAPRLGSLRRVDDDMRATIVIAVLTTIEKRRELRDATLHSSLAIPTTAIFYGNNFYVDRPMACPAIHASPLKCPAPPVFVCALALTY